MTRLAGAPMRVAHLDPGPFEKLMMAVVEDASLARGMMERMKANSGI